MAIPNINDSYPVAPLENLFNLIGDAAEVDDAANATNLTNALNVRQIKTYKWANAAARTAQVGMAEGDVGDQADTDAQYRYNGAAWVNLSSGITRLIPTVSGTGMSVSAAGLVTASGASAGIITFPGSASYDIIRVEVTSLIKSTANDLTARLTLATVPVSTSTYGQVRAFDNGTTRSISTVLGTGPSWNVDTSPSGIADFTLNLSGIALAEQTRCRDAGGSTSGYSWQNSMWNTTASAADGIQFNVSAGTYAFRATVFGVNL